MNRTRPAEAELHGLTSSTWNSVDHTADPNRFVSYLDAVTRQGAVQAYKQASYALLGLNPGDRALDVGCGTGDDAESLAGIVGPGGSVVGLDVSEEMIEESRRRREGFGRSLEFRVGDAHRLHFEDEAFDGVRADRVLQHLNDPEQALAELIRVTKPGGRVVVADTDWGTLAIDSPHRETTRAVLDGISAGIRNPWMGRQLYGLLGRAGLADVSAVSFAPVVTDFNLAQHLAHIGDGIEQAVTAGTITVEAGERWTQGLAEADEAGQFFGTVTISVVSGRRP